MSEPKSSPDMNSSRSSLIVVLIILLIIIIGGLWLTLYRQNELLEKLDDMNSNEAASMVANSLQPSSSVSTPSTSSIPSATNEDGEAMVDFYLVSPPIDDNFDELEKFMQPVKYQLSYQVSGDKERAGAALEALFAVDKLEYGESGLQNFLYLSDLEVDQISTQDGVDRVELSGKLVGIGSMADPLIKLQVEKTVSEYLDNYVITLNGQPGDWSCAFDTYMGCSQSAIVDDYLPIPLPTEPSDFSKDDSRYDYQGGLVVRGFSNTKTVNEAFCEEDCDQYEYVSFIVTESNAPTLDDFFADNAGNSAVGNSSIGIGCLEDGQIYYANHSDEHGVKDFRLSKSLTDKIMSSTSKSPVILEIEKLPLSGGMGAPTCYSLFTYFK